MYVASWSGGKDSTASIILAHEKGEPLDLIIFSEVMFDENISGELPEHMDFVYKCIERFKEWGYETKILHSDKTYMDLFMHKRTRGKYKGMLTGFPMMNKCEINGTCKVKAVRDFNKMHPDAIHYVGIAIDEQERLERLKPDCISLLEKYGMTEDDALELCKKYNMVSPIYSYSRRGGCWFCPNQRGVQLRHLREHNSDLWEKLLELEDVPNKIGYCWNTLKQISIKDKEQQFMWEDRQITLEQYLTDCAWK